ncbi:MAG: hypothetical protein K6L76_02460 [Agarilytica sp.]
MNAVEQMPDVFQGTDIYSVLGEPADPSSNWGEMRCTQLSGYDYIFLSSKVNSKLASLTTLSEFVSDIYHMMQTSPDRAKIFIYSHSPAGTTEFAAFEVTWKNGEIRDFSIRPIKNMGQKEFINTIFDHGDMLVGAA